MIIRYISNASIDAGDVVLIYADGFRGNLALGDSIGFDPKDLGQPGAVTAKIVKLCGSKAAPPGDEGGLEAVVTAVGLTSPGAATVNVIATAVPTWSGETGGVTVPPTGGT